MHEASIASALVDLVREEVAAARAARVVRIVIEIGALSHVDAHALRFAVEVVARGGPAEGSTLEVRERPGVAYCMDCEGSVTIAARGEACPHCGGVKLLAQGGDELRLKEMEVV